MNNDIFPKKECSSMPDRVWETYSSLVWGCNSMNAIEANLRHALNEYENQWGYYSGLLVVSVNEVETAIRELRKAQNIIMFLLADSGRLKEFESWEAKRNRNRRTGGVLNTDDRPNEVSE